MNDANTNVVAIKPRHGNSKTLSRNKRANNLKTKTNQATLTEEIELSQADKITLKQHIKVSLIVGLLFCIALVLIVAIVPALFLLFGKQLADGFVNRCLLILGLFFLPFLAISRKNFLKYVDIKRGKKLVIVTTDFEINKTKNSVSLRLIDNNNRKIEVWEELLPFINISRPLKIHIAILSKTILFISHDNKNLLDE